MVGVESAGQRLNPQLISQAAGRVRGLAAGYRAPDFAEAPGADAALFLCAIDHHSGYRDPHSVAGQGPYEGSALLWALGCAAERKDPGLLSAASLAGVDDERVEALFAVEGESVSGPGQRAALWRDLARGLEERYSGSAGQLLAAAGSRLGGPGGLIARMGEFEAFADPLRKKAYLFAKIAARRSWLSVADPKSWEICADNVLMRLALRAGLVRPGQVDEVRDATRTVFKQVAEGAGLEPPLLDDLLWELGRRDPDLLGNAGGVDLREPPRPQDTVWY